MTKLDPQLPPLPDGSEPCDPPVSVISSMQHAQEPLPGEDMFRRLFETAPDAQLLADSSGRILLVNMQAEQLFGYDRSELIGKPLEALMPERFRTGHTVHRCAYASAPSFRPMGAGLELYGLHKDGTEFPVEISLSPMETSNGVLFSSTIRDVSERKKMEQVVQSQLRFEKMMSQLSSTFVNIPAAQVDRKINESLRAVAECMDFDRSSIAQFDSVDNRLVVLSSWARSNVPPVGFQVANGHFPWIIQRLVAGQTVFLSDPNDLPEGAATDRESMLAIGEKSLLVFPLLIEERVTGAISFNTFRHTQIWEPWLLARLQHVADVFCGALARKKADDELQLAHSRIAELNERLEQENLYLRREINLDHNHSSIVGQSAVMKDVLKQAEQVAATESVVLIQGETGTGKELLAKTIHELSSRKTHPMVKINCAALPATLIESELFGREKGAYTGALTREIGRFELADKSTIFLDEISELPMELQGKLLRVLQEGEFERLGSPKTVRVDVRVIAATNRDLSAAVADGKFREDLFYRLSVFPILIPPLRERREDIEELVWHILQDLGKRMGKNIQTIQASTLKAFQSYGWPGNVRELRNVIERNLILNSGTVFRAKLPQANKRAGAFQGTRIQDVEREHILRVLQSTAWRVRGQYGAALLLGLKPTTLESRMKKLDIRRHN